VIWGIDETAMSDEIFHGDPWSLSASFLFPMERLRFLAFTNNYDAREDEPRWWWSHKAAATTAATVGGPADVVLPDGGPAWVDGGPRHPLAAMDFPVVHGESTEVGILDTVPHPTPPASSGLAIDQVDAVAHLAGAARVIAPAGSGKTRTLGARLQHLLATVGIEQQHLLGVAYNAKAAAELRDRTGSQNSLVRTIHSLGWEILRQHIPGLELVDEVEVRELLGRFVSLPQRANQDPMAPYLEALDSVRHGLVDPNEVEVERDDVPGFAQAFPMFRDRLYSSGRVDFGEQVYGAIEALLTMPELRRAWQRRCRHLLVDEFQDLTPAYLLLLRLVASPELSVFGVGDDDQVIYGYAGADPGFLIDFVDYFPGAGSHALRVNYRCPPGIVEAASNVLSYNRRRIDKEILPAKTSLLEDAMRVVKAPGADLASSAADTIGDWLTNGVPTSNIAVLTRVNSSLIPVKAALVERGIASNDRLTQASLGRTMVRGLFAWMRLAMSPHSMRHADLLEAIRRPSRGLNKVSRSLLSRQSLDIAGLRDLGGKLEGLQARKWLDFCEDVEAAAGSAVDHDAGELVREVVNSIGLGSSAHSLDSGRSVVAKSTHFDDLVAIERAAGLHPELDDFIPWLERALETKSQGDGVTLATVHRVKGMEWPHVIVFGADRGSMPHSLSDDVEEERRIFHVAITRAMEQVVVVADEQRPSRFLDELDRTAPDDVEPERPPEQMVKTTKAGGSKDVGIGDTVRISGGFVGVVAEAGDEVGVRLETGVVIAVPASGVLDVLERAEAPTDLMDTLKLWRTDTAQQQGVPAFVILHDSTIEALARARPATEAELLNVSGIGPTKLESYGDDILGIVASFRDAADA